MEKNFKISVVVPMYNSIHCVEKTLQSILMQSFREFELIIIDDGSTDGSADFASNYLVNSDITFKIIKQKNMGLSVARNVGIKNSTGKYISFIDSDDYINENYFEDLIKVSNDADVVCASIVYKYISSEKLYNQDIFKRNVVTKGDKYFNRVYSLINPMAANKLYKRDIFESKLFTKEVIFEDVLFWNEIVDLVDSIAFATESIYYYVIQGESLSNAVDVRYDNLYENWKKIIDFHILNGTFEKYFDVLKYGSTKYLKDIMIRKFSKVIMLNELVEKYNRSNKFIYSTFGKSRKNLMFRKNFRHFYIVTHNIGYVYLYWIGLNYRIILSVIKHKFLKMLFSEQQYQKKLELVKYNEIFVEDDKINYDKVPIPYFSSKYESYFYGIGKEIANYLNLSSLDNIFIEHGYNFSDYITENYSAISSKMILTTTKQRASIYSYRYGKKVLSVGPYFHYTKKFYDNEWEQNIKAKYGTILTVFPSHSISNYYSEYDVEEFKNEIIRVKEKYNIDTVFVCMYYRDVLLGNHKDFEEFSIVCTGHIHDIYALSKLKSIVRVSDYTMSNEIGSHIPNCFYLNKPHYLFARKVSYSGSNFDKDSKRMRTYKINESRIVNDIFMGKEFVKFSDNKGLINFYFNIDGVLSVGEFRRQLGLEYEV